jgi:hypothetical protein
LILAMVACSLPCVANPAAGGSRYVAVNGLDGVTCGAKASPCRSIRQAINNAVDGDTIIVGPGRYGDLNGNGTTGEPGEEVGFPFCGCMLGIDRAVTVVSSAGAAATVIDARSVSATRSVFLIGPDLTFGKPGKGFTVTGTALPEGDGITILGTNLKVRGNQVLADAYGGFLFGTGITTLDTSPGPVLIEANQATGWGTGILANAPGTIVRKNVVSLNGNGIIGRGSSTVISGNVATANDYGINVADSATAIGNAANGNRGSGVNAGSGAIVKQNNLFGNAFCGLFTDQTDAVVAAGNYWGAATGPGADPADVAAPPGFPCNKYQVPITSSPFATKPFSVKARIQP